MTTATAASTSALPPWRIGVDVGGTFTDLVLADDRGAVFTFKSPSNPSDPARGVMAAVAMAAAGLGLSVEAVLRGCRAFVHGSTIATNTILERKGAVVGLLTTEGFRDALEIRRGIREDAWDHRPPFPPVLVPRHLRLPVSERIDRGGQVVRPLQPDSVLRALEVFRREGVTSIAICFLNSFRNAAHERACAGLVRAAWPEVQVSISADIAPVVGEYERTSTAVLNAYVTPRVIPYLRQLEQDLSHRGLAYPLLLIQSNGGAANVDQLADRAVMLSLSGPAAGASALRAVAAMAGSDNLLLMEIGGTSCDVTLMSRGEIAMVDALSLNDYHLTLPSVDIHSVSGGGGTIAHVDRGGLLQVGPHGAGARPGPACYGFGGTDATVTDAHVLLGRLQSGGFANGLVMLNEALARTAVEQHVASPLGVDVVTAASGIIRLLEQDLRHAIEQISIERGHDPRQFVLVAGGGAGALHAVNVARALKCPKVYVPRFAGVFCAFGMCGTDIRQDFQMSWLRPLDVGDIAAIEHGFGDLTRLAQSRLEGGGFSLSDLSFERVLELRYAGQQWPLFVPVEALDIVAIRAAFEARHQRLYGHCQPDGEIEIVNLKLAGIGALKRVPPPGLALTDAPARPRGRRSIYLDAQAGFDDVAVYDGDQLRPGQQIHGPALIEERNTTILIGHGDRLDVDATGNFLIAVAEAFFSEVDPVRVKKTRQNMNLEPRFDSIETEKAPARERFRDR
jgi:N-methylhydantoinase A